MDAQPRFPRPADPDEALAALGPAQRQTTLHSLPLLARGKVRDLYAVGSDRLLMVASDRLSAFDVVMKAPVPGKGRLLTRMALFWFDRLAHLVPHHLTGQAPESVVAADERSQVAGRAMLVRRLRPLPCEAVVRGYVAGSGWKEYQRAGTVCGIALPPGLAMTTPLPEPIFTPATKAAVGDHDENISHEQLRALIGAERADEVRRTALALYREAAAYARTRGIVVADTKFEFGLDEHDRLTLMDEALTPDSSRLWLADALAQGRIEALDKQPLRDWLAGTGVTGGAEQAALDLPPQVIVGIHDRYARACRMLCGDGDPAGTPAGPGAPAAGEGAEGAGAPGAAAPPAAGLPAEEPSSLTVHAFHGLRPGPRLIVTGAVHGNETAGTRGIQQVLAEIARGEIRIVRGCVSFVPVTNPLAYAQGTRMGQRNLNRRLQPTATPQDFEDRVANVLCPLLAAHDVLLDLHSFRSPGRPFVMRGPADNAGALEPFAQARAEGELAAHLGVDRVVEGWMPAYAEGVARRRARGLTPGAVHEDPSYGVGTTEWMRSQGGYGVTLECGQHDDPAGAEVASHAIRQALALLGIAQGPGLELQPPRRPFECLRLAEVVDRLAEGDRFAREWRSFDPLAEGELVAVRADGTELRAPRAGYIVFPDVSARPGHEWYYLAQASERPL